MKKFAHISALLFLIAITVASCSKSSSNPAKSTTDNGDYYMKFKADGVDTKLTVAANSLFTQPSTVYSAGLYSYLENDLKKGAIILINDNEPIKTGKTYTEKLVTAGNTTLYQTSFNYIDKDSVTYFASGAVANENVNVQFTEITSSYVKGTFDGKLRRLDSKPPYVFMVVTEGEFYLARTFFK